MQSNQFSSRKEAKPLSGEQIRSAFLAFYEQRGHKVLPSASLVPDDPTVLLTIAGMLPFKPIFLGHEDPPALRVTTSQKCIRTNDIDNVGNTARHHTFFEMLGNFSFGDYFKKEAIQWAWELSTQVYNLDPKNLVVSVFRDDDESEQIWREIIGVPYERIIRMDEKDNFWSSGPTGPCGPCSEIYYDFHPENGDKNIDLEDDSRFIEFYNLVFMQFNRDNDGILNALDSFNIDTGLGLERMAQILQKVDNNYETDLIYPLLEKAASLAKLNYYETNAKKQLSLKVIGDHLRAIVHLIADGVTSSNLGRGYILRRLIRRVIRHGRQLGIKTLFLKDLAETTIQLMKSSYPNLISRRDFIRKELAREENRFLETLDRGEKLLAEIISDEPKQISGQKAFELYDTYGFPLELTVEIAQENSLNVDVDSFHVEMQHQRERAKSSIASIDLTIRDNIDLISREVGDTIFNGYTQSSSKSIIKALFIDGNLVDKASTNDEIKIILDETSFYAEGGGQIGDRGIIYKTIDGAKRTAIIEIFDVNRINNVFVHSGRVKFGDFLIQEEVYSQIDSKCRRSAQSNHTSTHLLQAALKLIVDADISQAGSLVGFDRLRFDFHSPTAITQNQINLIEEQINLWISESHPLKVQEMPLDDAHRQGAIAMFGEKYSDVVRVVNIPHVSMELCGGTHVSNTADIGGFKIISESGIASGIRRIEAVSGLGLFAYLNERDALVNSLSEICKANSNQIFERVVALQNDVKRLTKLLDSANDLLAKSKALGLADTACKIGNRIYLVHRFDGSNGQALQSAAKALVDKLGENAAVFLGGCPDLNEKKVILVAAFGRELIAEGLSAGSFIAPVAKLCGGGGGGKPELAQAGGKNPNELENALNFAREELFKLLA